MRTTAEQNVDRARKLIANCERDLNRALSSGECRDLLMDNTRWERAEIVAIVDTIRPAAPQ